MPLLFQPTTYTREDAQRDWAQMPPDLRSQFGTQEAYYQYRNNPVQFAENRNNNLALIGSMAAIAVLIFAPGSAKLLAVPIWILSPRTRLGM